MIVGEWCIDGDGGRFYDPSPDELREASMSELAGYVERARKAMTMVDAVARAAVSFGADVAEVEAVMGRPLG